MGSGIKYDQKMTKTICQSEKEAEALARKTASSGYISLHIPLSIADIYALLEGKCIYDVCNQEYGVLIETELGENTVVQLEVVEYTSSRND